MVKQKQKIKRTLKGMVVSDKMQKTIVIEVTRYKQHPKYKKYYKVTKRYKAHDENNEYHSGDTVLIEEMRPISKEKRWRVVKLINRGQVENLSDTELINSSETAKRT